MFPLTRILCIMGLVSSPVFASPLLFQGTFTADDNVALIPFSVSITGIVTVQSFGYAGGTTANSTVVAEGGFAPNVLIFDNLGNEIVSDNGGHCAITGADSVTGNCDDSYIEASLGAGSYTLALVEWDNTTADGTLAGGFKQDGNPGFTCASFGASGNFCDVTTALGTQRNGNYAIQINGSLATPEPSTLFPSAFVWSLIALSQRRKMQSILSRRIS